MQNIRIKFSFLIDDGECYHTDDPGIGMEDFYYLMALDSDDCNETCESLLTHYQENKILSFTVQCTEATTICDIQKVISDKIGFVWSRFLEMPLHTAFFCDGHFVHVRSPEVTLSTIRKWYNIENELRIFFVLCDQAGTIWHDDEDMYLSDMESYIKEQLLNFIYGDRPLTQEEYNAFIQELNDVYGFDAYMEAANEQLAALGLVTAN